MKKLLNIFFGIGLFFFCGCGKEQTNNPVAVEGSATPTAGTTAPVPPKRPAGPKRGGPAGPDRRYEAAPPTPESLIINATVGEALIGGRHGFISLDLTLTKVTYENTYFRKTLDLDAAEKVSFGSVHDLGCPKDDFEFVALAPNVDSTHNFKGPFSSRCNGLFHNIRKHQNMHIRFENVPLADDHSVVIPYVEIRLNRPAKI